MEKVYLVWWSNAEEYPEDFEEGTAGIYSTSDKAIAKAEKMLSKKDGMPYRLLSMKLLQMTQTKMYISQFFVNKEKNKA